MWSLVWFTMVAVSWADVPVIDNTVIFATEATGAERNPTLEGDQIEPYNSTQYDVTIDQTIIKGVLSENIVQYFDIPYGTFAAETPFQKPSAFPTGEADVIENIEHNSRCPQINSENQYIGNDTCLTLSIFRPTGAQAASVLFHIHDSAGNTGSGDPSKYGAQRLASRGIMLVLPNYRIGALGFLCSQSEEAAPGNAGLRDLHLALEWTHNHIAKFGGNQSSIVVSGSGVGGALVEYLLLSGESRKFISKAITESGSALAPWALDRDPAGTEKLLRDALNRIGKPETVRFYNLGSNLEKLVRAAQNFDMAPCVEKNQTGFVTETPWHKLSHENLEITLMMGTANYAAKDIVTGLTEQTWSQINNDNTMLLPSDLRFNNAEDKNYIARKIRTKYFGELNITSNDERRLLKCYSDSLYLYPGIRSARLLVRRGATIYFYEFSKSNGSSGSGKGDSLNQVFSRAASEDVIGSENGVTMLNFWSSFINQGKPSADGIDWTSLTAVAQPAQEAWLSFGDTISVRRGFHGDRLQIWDDICQNQFVERSRGPRLNSSIYVTLLATMFMLDLCSGFKL